MDRDENDIRIDSGASERYAFLVILDQISNMSFFTISSFQKMEKSFSYRITSIFLHLAQFIACFAAGVSFVPFFVALRRDGGDPMAMGHTTLTLLGVTLASAVVLALVHKRHFLGPLSVYCFACYAAIQIIIEAADILLEKQSGLSTNEILRLDGKAVLFSFAGFLAYHSWRCVKEFRQNREDTDSDSEKASA